MRPRDGAKPIEVSAMKKALEDKRFWCGLGLVVKRDGDSSHFEIETDGNGNPVDVLVEIDLMPEKTPLFARLGAGMGSLGSGGWKIPAPGTEVAVLIPTGDIEADPIIVAALSSGSVPSALDADTYVLVQPKNVVIASSDAGSKVKLGAPDGSTNLQPAVLGNDLEARLSDLESKFNGHTHAFTATATYQPATPASGGTAPAGTTAAPTQQHTDQRNIKAANVEVK